tara:strand:- start:344 stop:514 length:171 start_codon:yes stop_codon:yes gene_type:complete
LYVLSFILIIEGLFPLFSPKSTKRLLSYALELDENTIRILGGTSVFLGFLIYISIG